MKAVHGETTLEMALAIRAGVPHLERVMAGIRSYAAAHESWRFLISPETHDLSPADLQGWKGAGVIALCNTTEDKRVLESLECPVVNISGVHASTKFPRVRTDYYRIGEEGASLLRKRGFQRFGFYGVEGVWYSSEIERGFRDALSAQSLTPESHHGANSIEQRLQWNTGRDDLEEWLRSQTPPFAIMATHDPRAIMVIRACERIGYRVPEDVAVLGVNDDTVTCEFSRPTLSSIERNSYKVGTLAAATLADITKGKKVPGEIIVPPGPCRERESTQIVTTEDPILAHAVQLISESSRKPISIEKIAERVGRSRRWLEYAFLKELSTTPSQFLRETRVRAAKSTLEKSPRLSASALASQSGFSDARQLQRAIEKVTGASFSAFREEIENR